MEAGKIINVEGGQKQWRVEIYSINMEVKHFELVKCSLLRMQDDCSVSSNHQFEGKIGIKAKNVEAQINVEGGIIAKNVEAGINVEGGKILKKE